MSVVRTKLQLVCELVDWEHRYKFGQLQGGSWCLGRVRELMELPKPQVQKEWSRTFELTPERKTP